MPRIFDNIEQFLSEELGKALKVSYRSDFCVGYFNLRGWKHLDSFIDKFEGGKGKQCRLLIGMNVLPHYSVHSLRHTYATLLYKSSGNNLRLVQQQLGHSSVQTTTVYANVVSEDVEKAVNGIIKES